MKHPVSIISVLALAVLIAEPSAAWTQDADQGEAEVEVPPAGETEPAAADGSADAEQVDEDEQDDEPTNAVVEAVIDRPQAQAEQESGDNVIGKLLDASEANAGLFEHGPLTALYNQWRPFRDRLANETGLSLGIAYTTLFQYATSAKGPNQAWSGDFDLFGKWDLVNRGEPEAGALGFAVEQRHRFTEIAPAKLGASIGAQWGTTRGFNVEDLALVQFWWEQFLFDDHVRLTVGKLDPTSYYNGNRFQSQNTFFLNRAFSDNPARGFPDNSLGLNLRFAPSDGFYVTAGVHNASGTKTSTGFNSLKGAFSAIEIGITPAFRGWKDGRYRFTFWYNGGGTTTGDESGSGLALSFDQDLGNGIIPFFRYGYQDRGLTDTRQIISTGVGIQRPFDRPDDLLGIGFAWGEPSDRALRDQYVVEIFDRIQLTPKMQLTPGYQIIVDPTFNPGKDVVGVFELRLRILF